MIMSPSRQRDSWTGHSSDFMFMPIVKRCNGKVFMGMWYSGRRRFCCSGIPLPPKPESGWNKFADSNPIAMAMAMTVTISKYRRVFALISLIF
jgi:hypothetical protein